MSAGEFGADDPPACHVCDPQQREDVVEPQPAAPVEASDGQCLLCGVFVGRVMAPAVSEMECGDDMEKKCHATGGPNDPCGSAATLAVSLRHVDQQSRQEGGDRESGGPGDG